MLGTASNQRRQRDALRDLLVHVAEMLNSPVSVKLWDGTIVPMGTNANPELCITISGPGVIASLLRRPTLDNLLRHYVRKHFDIEGTDLYTFLETARVRGSRKRVKTLKKSMVVRSLLPFLFSPGQSTRVEHCFSGDESGHNRAQTDNKDFIQFHYDVSNEFYSLFLDPEMVYSCAYFTDWNNSLEQAQHDKLDMICRKLQLKPGETFLDIGSGWGALICHAAQHYGVRAHGITLSERQLQFTQEKIEQLGLGDRVTAELRDYADLNGTWDKVASIGMVEHVGIDNMGKYMQAVRRVLPDRGMFLCHGVTRRAKANRRRFRKTTSERRLLTKYIFPGGELDSLGHMVEMMESSGFEVHDVEGWRDHYALTCKHWVQRLTEQREEAIRHVGEDRYRIWQLYLACVSLALHDGTACIYQTVATRHVSKGLKGLPPTREHLYQTAERSDASRKVA